MAQLEGTGAVVKWKWGLKEDPWGNGEESIDEEDGDKEERSKDGLKENQKEVEEGTLSLIFY